MSNMAQDPDISRIVVKLGTSVLTDGTNQLSKQRILGLVEQIVALHQQGYEVIVVSSGAAAAGREVLNQPNLSKVIPIKQMLSAIGQPRLMHLYADMFSIFDIFVAQVLLTKRDLRNRSSYLNARDTLESLLKQRIVPIINENDTVAIDEIKLGDNDNLSALVANLVDASLLTILTDQPGLFSTDPRTDPDAKLISVVDRIDDDVFSSAGGTGTTLGTGGMVTKLQAAQLATRSGTTVVIASGSRPNVLLDLVGDYGSEVGTWFPKAVSHIESRKRWLVSEAIAGTLTVDNGASRALKQGDASLLPVGVTKVDGEFARGVVVSVVDLNEQEIARGLVNYNAADLFLIRGVQSHQIETTLGYTYGDEAIHRDHLIIL